MAIWFTSDTHFQHRLVAGLRGYPETELSQYNDDVIGVWNTHVRPDDFVWHLGDVALGDYKSGLRLVSRLNGHKHLIMGNHDKVWSGHRDARRYQREYLEVFESIQAFAKIKVAGIKNSVLLSHFPWKGDGEGERQLEERYGEFRLNRDPERERWLIHGHTHSARRLDGPDSIHVGWDAWNRPAHYDEIRALMGVSA